MKTEDKIKLFAFSNQMIEKEINTIEKKLGINIKPVEDSESDRDEQYYPQFEQSVRNEASEMATHYELFYCLEKSIRTLIMEKLEAEFGANWWDSVVPESIRVNVKNNFQKELDAGFTPRSTEEIDYTTFGELGEIVRNNWDSFSDTFNSQKAFTKVMTNLNILRGPIAHCSPLAEDEIVRLRLTVKDWFRLME